MSRGAIFVAGASGSLGRRVVAQLLERGQRVRVLVRDPAALGEVSTRVEVYVGDALCDDGLADAMAGSAAAFSALGASVRPTLGAGRAGFLRVDTPANLRLIEAAQRAKVPRFIYVSLFVTPRAATTSYVVAHERVTAALRTGDLDWCVLRPTGFHSAFVPMLDLAASGRVPLFGDGSPRTNPIATEDLAEVAVSQLLAAARLSERELPLGGPEVLTRRRIAELACEMVGRGRVLSLPEALGRVMAWCIRPISPRMSDLLRFVLAVGSEDAIAPVCGTRTLADTFAEELARRRGPRALGSERRNEL
jgi:uncharacterized protein YbjT (DUF2867 family)